MADGHSTYVLDMGDPVRIVDLVESFARLLNVREVEFEFTGLRPGEKMNEELFGCGEHPEPSSHRRISMTRPVLPAAGFRARLQELYDAAAAQPPGRGARPPLATGSRVPTRRPPACCPPSRRPPSIPTTSETRAR